MLIYLGLSALAVFIAAMILSVFAQSSTLAITHLVLVAAIVPLIFGAITHFVPVLTRGRAAHRAVLLLPLALQLAGVLVFMHFSGWLGLDALYLAVGIALLVSIGFLVWLVGRARNTLGHPHPCWRWYLAAIAVLIVGLLLVPAMYFWGAERQGLRLLHLHINLLGFVGLTAIGTLQVLLPTALAVPDPGAATRLRKQLLPMVIGVALVGVGAAFWRGLAIAGAALLIYPSAQLGYAWWRRYGRSMIRTSGAASSLFVALCGFLLLLFAGVLHAFAWLDARAAIPALFVAFLLPLVTGALTQLLPVWCHPGRRTPQRDQMHALMCRAALLRSSLFLTGGLLLLFGRVEGVIPSSLGLLLFVAITAHALFSSSPDSRDRIE